MNSSMKKKAKYLQDLLESNGILNKQAQEITHKNLDASQPTIGNKMQNEIEDRTQGNYASDPSVDASIEGEVVIKEDKVEGPEDKAAAKDLAETGTSIKTITPEGKSTSMPKSATLTKVKAAVNNQLRKEAAYQENEITTATEVMHKIAALNECKTEDEVGNLMQDIEYDFKKLASTNPLFNEACEAVMMRKMAEEIDALAAAEGIPEEEAAAALDASMAEDPEAQAEFNDEVQGEALSELADLEGAQAEMAAGLESAAAEASAALGQEVTPDDIVTAVEDVVAQAEQMGVEPEVLIQAAAEEMMQGAGDEVTGEDMAAAEGLLEEAAANGVSPEELIAGLSAEVEGGAPEEAPVEEAPAGEAPVEEGIEKEACLRKLASTKRGANLAYILEQAKKRG